MTDDYSELNKILAEVESLLEQGKADEAWGIMTGLPAGQRTDDLSLLMQLRIFQAAPDWDRAELVSRAMIAARPNSGENWFTLAYSQMMLRQRAKARVSLKNAIALQPELRMQAMQHPILARLLLRRPRRR